MRWLVPPERVEHLLGDLQERIQGVEPGAARRQYVLDAIVTVPSVIFSRVLRGCDVRLACLYAVIQYAALGGVALLERYRHGIQVTAGSLAIIWWITLIAVGLKLVQNARRPRGTSLAFFVALLVVTFAPSEHRLLINLGGGIVVGEPLLDFAHYLFEKHFTGPRGRKAS